MDFNINSFDLLMVSIAVMTYAFGAAVWTCLDLPALLVRAPAMDGYGVDRPFQPGEPQ